jgi:hypothetical protein
MGCASPSPFTSPARNVDHLKAPSTKGASMRTVRIHCRVVCFVGAMALLIPFAPVMAAGDDDPHRPVEVTFTKWVTTSPLMEGFWGGDLANKYVGEILQRQVSVNPALNTIVRLEAIYQFHHENQFLTALIRGGTNNVTGAAQLDGVVVAGWRTGAPVHVEFDTIPGIPGIIGCAGAPAGKTCFVGTIHVGRAPRD